MGQVYHRGDGDLKQVENTIAFAIIKKIHLLGDVNARIPKGAKAVFRASDGESGI
jgi:hypothetical protein